MTKSDNRLGEISLASVSKPQTTPTWSEGQRINAFDTETSDGDVFALSYVIDGNENCIGNNTGKPLSKSLILDTLTRRQCQNAINVWYNLDFDANAILGTILSQEQMAELTITNNTTIEYGERTYTIKYIKSKFLMLASDLGRKYKFFDIAQYFYTDLDSAAQEWLGKSKLDAVETKKFGTTPCDNHDIAQKDCNECWDKDQALNYIQSNYDTIKKYAIQDAKITHELADALITQAESLEIPMGAPFSTGYISAEYFRNKMDQKPHFGIQDLQKDFWESYAGGRFEVFERGNVGDVVGADINSAYPAVMSELPAPATLDWKKLDNPTIEDIEEADYGVVKGRFATNPNKRIQPFQHKLGGTNKFPILGGNNTKTVLKDIFEFAYNNNYLNAFGIEHAWLGYETEETEYPFKFMKGLYGDRKLAENRLGKIKKGQLLKIILNSGYGKTCQTTENMRIIDTTQNESYQHFELETMEDGGFKIKTTKSQNFTKPHSKMLLSKKQREIIDENEMVIKQLEAGRRFNPFFASYITGITRLKLHKTVEEYDLVEDTVMFATDCIMVKKDAFYESEFSDELLNKDYSDLSNDEYKETIIDELGGWDYEYKGHAFVIGSGVYQVNYDDGGQKMKTRGFPEHQIEGTLVENAFNYTHGIPIKNERPVTIGELMQSNDMENPVSPAQFQEMRKELKADFDVKRDWPRDSPTFQELLDISEDSRPIDLPKRNYEAITRQIDKKCDNSDMINSNTSQLIPTD